MAIVLYTSVLLLKSRSMHTRGLRSRLYPGCEEEAGLSRFEDNAELSLALRERISPSLTTASSVLRSTAAGLSHTFCLYLFRRSLRVESRIGEE